MTRGESDVKRIPGDPPAQSPKWPVEPTVPTDVSPVSRSPKLLFVAVGATLLLILLILLVVLCVPPADPMGNIANLPTGSNADELVGSIGSHSDLVLPWQAEEIDTEKAEKELIDMAESLLEFYPRDSHALFVAGMVFSELQQSTRAEQVLRRCVNLSSNEFSAYVVLAENLMLMGSYEEAVDVLRDAMAQGKTSPRAIRALAEASAHLGRLEDATRVLREGVQDFPTEAQNWLRLGQMQIQVRRFQEAEGSLRQAMKLGEAGGQLLVALNTSLLRQGKNQEASGVRKQLADMRSHEKSQAESVGGRYQTGYTEIFQHNSALWHAAGASVYLDHGERGRAETHLRRAISLAPQQIRNYVPLVSLYHRDGRLADAIVVLQRLTVLQPDKILYYLNLATIAGQLGKEDLAESVLQQAVPRDTSGAAHFQLAKIYVSQGRTTEAREAAETAAERIQNVDAYLLLKSICETVGDDAAANKALQMARQLAPNDPRLNSGRF